MDTPNTWWPTPMRRCYCQMDWTTNRPHRFSVPATLSGRDYAGLSRNRANALPSLALAVSAILPCNMRRPQVRQLGADEIVRDGKGLAVVGGADVILGTSNSVDAMADSIAGLRPDGRLVLMGFENKPLPLHPADLISRRIRILWSQQNDREYLYEAYKSQHLAK